MHTQTNMDKKYLKKNILSFLPGKKTAHSLKAQMLRVDHAGEFGAVHIYRGQIDALYHASRQYNTILQVQEMRSQEVIHLEKFEKVLPQRHIRPSVLTPIWHLGGYVMGAITMLISPKSAMACTEAVETVIDKHYDTQINFFKNEKHRDSLINDLQKFQQDELAHKHEAIESDAHQAPFYKITTWLISILCHNAIKIAHKI